MKKLSAELVRFLLLAVLGLTLDLWLFGLGIRIGLSVFFASLTSSGFALLIIYQLALWRVFKSQGSWPKLFAYFGWYAISIASFSYLAQWIFTNTFASEFQSKVAVVGPSFLTNFIVVRTILTFRDKEPPRLTTGMSFRRQGNSEK